MSTNNETLQILKEGFDEVIARYAEGSDNVIMTDILLQITAESGLLTIYDDDDEEIYSSVVEEWVGDATDDYYDNVAQTIKTYIQQNAGVLENLSILKPYSFVLVDDDKETLTELHLVDDQLIVLDSESLMENLDKDLDDFFNKLMAE